MKIEVISLLYNYFDKINKISYSFLTHSFLMKGCPSAFVKFYFQSRLLLSLLQYLNGFWEGVTKNNVRCHLHGP